MIQDIQAAKPLGFFLAFMIGPVFFVLIETSATKGFRAAVAFDIGVILADIIFIGVAYFSSFQLLENLSNNVNGAKLEFTSTNTLIKFGRPGNKTKPQVKYSFENNKLYTLLMLWHRYSLLEGR